MPIYEYDCSCCGVVEVFQSITEKPLTKCPSCHKRKVKKLISESAFHLKGSGWYTTDYARKGNGGNGGNGKKHAEDHPSEKSCDTKETTAPKGDAKEKPAKETAKPSDSATASSS